MGMFSPRELPKCSPGRWVAHPAELENQAVPCYQTGEKALTIILKNSHTQIQVMRSSFVWIEENNFEREKVSLQPFLTLVLNAKLSSLPQQRYPRWPF